MQAVGSAWERSLRRAEIEKFRFHDLRHMWASWHVMSGTRLQELMELGRWKSFEKPLMILACPERFELPTPWFVGRIER